MMHLEDMSSRTTTRDWPRKVAFEKESKYYE